MKNKFVMILAALNLLGPFSFADENLLAGPAFKMENLLQRQNLLWSFDFIDQNQVLLTEKQGKLLVLDLTSKKLVEVNGVPKSFAYGQGGLLDVRIHPDFAKNSLVYLSFTDFVDNSYTTSLAVGKLQGTDLMDVKKLFVAKAGSRSGVHFGSRIEFDLDGHLFLSIGERGDRDKAQVLSNHHGKIVRLMLDGSIPKDNPFIGIQNAMPEIWSFGHRNPQGLARHPVTNELWEAEFGPQGGDEINLIKKGANYGWPVVTFGEEYGGGKIGEGTRKDGMEDSLAHYVPSISPSGIGFYAGDKFPQWKNSLFVAALSGSLKRIEFNKDNQKISEEDLLKERGFRFRAVKMGPEGYLYFVTDQGLFARLVPN